MGGGIKGTIMRFQILITSASLAIGKALSVFKENDLFKFSHSNQWQFCCLITLERSICFGEKRKCGQPTRHFLPFDRTPALAHIYRTLLCVLLHMRRAVKSVKQL